ncbi:CMP-N-acetylneuraminate-beta-galactosamide-alpha-2,3-sialyltransferase 4-like [Hemiscyllium ocellatum]|uniref:CMP-N-acetylneuraminate-beta-galactosamide- alpha-2,3-sialyltransferase 4-like n=1 Tax=Hemiscyllium ocellatum TaxID=170820 RepID=UPI0029664167|nr:CMP-N-acetylneuraminate-beta-galactosamide-alpha-2,3-sialyltransferase 4-like [Hemiscyllium ocellatum]
MQEEEDAGVVSKHLKFQQAFLELENRCFWSKNAPQSRFFCCWDLPDPLCFSHATLTRVSPRLRKVSDLPGEIFSKALSPRSVTVTWQANKDEVQRNQDAQCTNWLSKEHNLSVLSNFIRNTDIFLSIAGGWWYQPNHLHHSLPYGIKGNEAIVKKILAHTMFSMPEEINRLDCKRCVIVGNGDTLRNSSLGETINKYDIVIRLNNAPVRGYEKDVGNKTTLRIFYPESTIEDPTVENNFDTLFVLVPFKTADIHWLKAIVYNETKITAGFWRRPAFVKNLDPAKLRILNPYYMYQAATYFLSQPNKRRGNRPTTGFLAVTLGLNYCDEIDVAGFGYPLNQKNGRIHYFDQLSMKHMSNTVHNVTHEHLFLKTLKNAGVIKYLT